MGIERSLWDPVIISESGKKNHASIISLLLGKNALFVVVKNTNLLTKTIKMPAVWYYIMSVCILEE